MLLQIVANHRPAFSQERPYQRCVALTLGMVCALSRHTITQLLVALGLGRVDWSGFYRLFSVPRLDYARLSACLVTETLDDVPSSQPYVVALDGVQIPRSSQRMPGTSWLKAPRTPPWKPGIHRAQRFVHLALLVPAAASGYSRAIPLRLWAAFPASARPAGAGTVQREWEAGHAALVWVRQTLDAAGRASQRLVAIADSSYGPAAMWSGLPERTVLMTRCAKNRALYQLPPLPHHGRGRPRRYGARARGPAAWLEESAGWQHTRLTVRGRSIGLTYRVAGPYLLRTAASRPVYLLVVRGVKRKHGPRRDPTFWLVSAEAHAAGRWRLPLRPADLLALAWQRWEIEVTHRDAKTGIGVGEAQCWTPTSTVLATQWQWWVLGVVLLTGYRVWGLAPAPPATTTRWWGGSRRWSLGQLWQALRAEVWQLAEFQPPWTRFTPDWWKMADWIDLQTAALLGARRG
jgi:hypothetical protein